MVGIFVGARWICGGQIGRNTHGKVCTDIVRRDGGAGGRHGAGPVATGGGSAVCGCGGDAALEELGIPFDRVDHDPAEDMADCAVISQALGADICKNLLLTPRNRSAFYLLAMPGDKPFVTKELSKQIGSSRLSFATAEDLEQLLGVQPGSASVLGLLNDTEHRVTLVLDRAVAESRWFGCHPCRNTSSLRLRTEDVLEKFLPYTGHVPLVVEL